MSPLQMPDGRCEQLYGSIEAKRKYPNSNGNGGLNGRTIERKLQAKYFRELSRCCFQMRLRSRWQSKDSMRAAETTPLHPQIRRRMSSCPVTLEPKVHRRGSTILQVPFGIVMQAQAQNPGHLQTHALQKI